MPTVTPISHQHVIGNVLESVRTAVRNVMLDYGPGVKDWKSYIGWSDPPLDCCPEIMVWANNLRPDPDMSTQTGSGSNIGCIQYWMLDVHVRISDCYVDQDDEGSALPANELTAQSADMYEMLQHGYWGVICAWQQGKISEVRDYTKVLFSGVSTFGEGGCGGMDYTITLSFGQ